MDTQSLLDREACAIVKNIRSIKDHNIKLNAIDRLVAMSVRKLGLSFSKLELSVISKL